MQMAAGVPAAKSPPTYAACAGVNPVKVRAIGFNPGIAGMLTLETPFRVFTGEKPRLLPTPCSNEPKKRFFA